MHDLHVVAAPPSVVPIAQASVEEMSVTLVSPTPAPNEPAGDGTATRVQVFPFQWSARSEAQRSESGIEQPTAHALAAEATDTALNCPLITAADSGTADALAGVAAASDVPARASAASAAPAAATGFIFLPR